MVDARQDERVIVRAGKHVVEREGATVTVHAPRDVRVCDWAPLVELAIRPQADAADKVA